MLLVKSQINNLLVIFLDHHIASSVIMTNLVLLKTPVWCKNDFKQNLKDSKMNIHKNIIIFYVLS